MKQFATTYRAGAKKKVPRLIHFPKPRNRPKEDVLEMVRELALKMKKHAEETDCRGYLAFRAEDVAKDLNVEVSKVIWSFHKLNLDGILHQRSRVLPHDTNRDRDISWGFSNETGWAANIYHLVLPPRKKDLPGDLPGTPDSPPGTISTWDEKDYVKRPRFSKRLGERLVKKVIGCLWMYLWMYNGK